MRFCLRHRAFAIAVLGTAALFAGPGSASAGDGDITFCNEFPQTIFVAIAYPQADTKTYLSRGWLEIGSGKCYIFDMAIRVNTFYYRAESRPYRSGRHRVKMYWGEGKSFAIYENSNFQYYDAEKRVLNSRLAEFSQGPESTGGPVTATVTFKEQGSDVTIPSPSDGTGSEPSDAWRTSPDNAGHAPSLREEFGEGGNSAPPLAPPLPGISPNR